VLQKKRRINENVIFMFMKISEKMNFVRMNIIGKTYSSRTRRGGIKRHESDQMGSGTTWKIA
jgi:hypothetical protein